MDRLSRSKVKVIARARALGAEAYISVVMGDLQKRNRFDSIHCQIWFSLIWHCQSAQWVSWLSSHPQKFRFRCPTPQNFSLFCDL